MNKIPTREELRSALGGGQIHRVHTDALGIGWPPTKGWAKRLLSRGVTLETWEAFMNARKPVDELGLFKDSVN